MPQDTRSCRECKGKYVSRSTYYGHSKKRVQENVEALQAQDITLLSGDVGGEGIDTAGGDGHQMG